MKILSVWPDFFFFSEFVQVQKCSTLGKTQNKYFDGRAIKEFGGG